MPSLAVPPLQAQSVQSLSHVRLFATPTVSFSLLSLFPAVLGLRCRAWGLLSVAVRRLLLSAASLVERGRWGSSRSQQLWHTGSAAPRHVRSSRTRDRARVPCIDRSILNRWATREVLTFLYSLGFSPSLFRFLEKELYPCCLWFSTSSDVSGNSNLILSHRSTETSPVGVPGDLLSYLPGLFLLATHLCAAFEVGDLSQFPKMFSCLIAIM